MEPSRSMKGRLAALGRTCQTPPTWIGVEADWRQSPRLSARHFVSLTPAELRTHALLLGATGSGKTTLLHHLIAQDILLGHSFVVLDLRGDLVSAVLSLCAGRVDPSLVKIIDLREKERPFGFNPLAGPGEPYFHALNVLDVVAAESESWGVQLQETLRLALLALAEAGEPLTGIEKLFYNDAYRSWLLQSVTAEDVSGFWTRYSSAAPERRQTLAAPVLNKVSHLFATRNLRAMFSHPEPIELGAHLNTPGSILLVSLAADEMHSVGRMVGSLVLGSLTREMFARVTLPESQRNPVRLYVDEFEHFGSRDFEVILAEGRRFGMSLVLAHQTFSQIAPKLRSIILGNVGTKACFRLGREDSTFMCQDLTFTRNAIDFTCLKTGNAVLARSGRPLAGVEVNAPLFPRGGCLTPEGKTFRDEVFASCSTAEELRSAASPTPEPTPRAEEPKSKKKTAKTRLEDWL